MPHHVHVNLGVWQGPAGLLEAAVLVALAEAGDADAEISLTLVGEEAIRELNERYLENDQPTDVIAFSLGEPGEVLGDVYVCFPQARHQAEEVGASLDEELVRLAVHGTLHVLGHDHPEGPERSQSPMFRRQEEIVSDVVAGHSGS